MILKIVFLIAGVAGIVLVFLVSWFWTLLLAPMVIILAIDIVSNFFKKRGK